MTRPIDPEQIAQIIRDERATRRVTPPPPWMYDAADAEDWALNDNAPRGDLAWPIGFFACALSAFLVVYFAAQFLRGAF